MKLHLIVHPGLVAQTMVRANHWLIIIERQHLFCEQQNGKVESDL